MNADGTFGLSVVPILIASLALIAVAVTISMRLRVPREIRNRMTRFLGRSVLFSLLVGAAPFAASAQSIASGSLSGRVIETNPTRSPRSWLLRIVPSDLEGELPKLTPH